MMHQRGKELYETTLLAWIDEGGREKSTMWGRWGKGHCVDQGSDRDDSARRGARWPNRGMRAAVAGST